MLSFEEVQAEVQGWSPEEQCALLAFLNVLQFRREGVDSEELRRRIDDRSKEAWVSLDDARQRLAD